MGFTLNMSTKDYKKFADGTSGASMSKGEDGTWIKNTTAPTPKKNAVKINSNAKKIDKLMAIMKRKGSKIKDLSKEKKGGKIELY